jgi:hypothetical protein
MSKYRRTIQSNRLVRIEKVDLWIGAVYEEYVWDALIESTSKNM